MSIHYLRQAYGVPAKRGGRVKFTGNPHNCPQFGTITGASCQYLKVRMDGEDKSGTYHPTWEIEYLPPNAGGKRSDD